MRRVGVAVVLAAVVCSRSALAHGGGNGASLHEVLGPVSFLAGVAVVGGVVVLDAKDAIARRRADLAVVAGGALAVVGLGTYVAV